MATKICRKCKVEKDSEDFGGDPRNDDGKRNNCKACCKIVRQAWLKANPERVRGRVRNQPLINERNRRNRRNETPEQRRHRLERESRSHAKLRARRMAEFLAEFGQPMCECGCGGAVGFDKNGDPCSYVIGHQPHRRTREPRQPVEYLPHEKVKEVFVAYRDKHGLTWAQVADQAGVSVGSLYSIVMHGSTKRHRKDIVEKMLRNLAGVPKVADRALKDNSVVVYLPGGVQHTRYGTG